MKSPRAFVPQSAGRAEQLRTMRIPTNSQPEYSCEQNTQIVFAGGDVAVAPGRCVVVGPPMPFGHAIGPLCHCQDARTAICIMRCNDAPTLSRVGQWHAARREKARRRISLFADAAPRVGPVNLQVAPVG
jgi:hypothetical protein